ncbi:hypothetical protein HAX54_002711 [Datura stramonium]|uniref:SNRNP25 ubiquitin-like domain-containing protein n=1 Tax=Datura stramonium TaxID=4076 RepID=A0ABS8RWI8_DATST|nr:hypothetical protein [Datura stramonium]
MVKIIACFQLQNRSSRARTPFPINNGLVRSFGYRKLPEQRLNLSVLKLDGSSFVIQVARNATLADLKQAVEEAFNFSREDEGKILWSLVWSHFCLCYGCQRLVNDKAFISCFGIKDGDQLQFAQHVTLEYRPAKQRLESQYNQSKQCSISNAHEVNVEDNANIDHQEKSEKIGDFQDESRKIGDFQDEDAIPKPEFKLSHLLRGWLSQSKFWMSTRKL